MKVMELTELAELRETWEKHLTVLAVVDRRKDAGHVLVILRDLDPEWPEDYHCHRYFTLPRWDHETTHGPPPKMAGVEWVVSVDGQRVSLEAVWRWLTDPSAASCSKRREHHV